MNSLHLKNQLQHYIEKADEGILRTMLAMMEKHFQSKGTIVAYAVKGQALTENQLEVIVDKATKEIRNGKGFSSDEIRELKKSWGKK